MPLFLPHCGTAPACGGELSSQEAADQGDRNSRPASSMAAMKAWQALRHA